MNSEDFLSIAADDKLIEVGRQAIENALIEFRDSRISEPGRGNGLVCREADGRESSIIRFGSEAALRIALKAMAATMNGGAA